VLTNLNYENESCKNLNDNGAQVVWGKFLEIISTNVSELKLNTWFKPIKAKLLENETLTIVVPSKDYYDMIITRFGDIVSKAIKAVLGDNGKLIYEIEITPVSGAESILVPEISAEKSAQLNTQQNNAVKPVNNFTQRQNENPYESASYFNTEYNFETFVKGKNNEFATAAALSICNRPGAQYNPLMIYGGVGLGKTHLIQAIGNQLRANRPDIKMMYISGPEFTTSFVQSIRTNKAHEFEKYYKSLDILIVDDVQFLEGKESTQDSFFQIFNSLYQLKKQIVLSSDKPPHQLTGLEERLITRFQWGLTVDIQPPDLETRIAILNKKSETENISVPFEVLEFIAINIKDNIRSLEGCLKSLIFDSELTKMPINLDMAKRSVVKFGAIRNRKLNLDIGSIIVEVSKFFDLEESLLRLKTKRQEIVQARHAAMFLCREMTSCSLETVGAHFGGRNHATVIHACKCVEQIINSDPAFKEKIEKIKENLLTS
jgi:chromosomal replication initiator protein